MMDNPIITELRAMAELGWIPELKHFFEQRVKDARPVECVRMKDVFTSEQLRFLFETMKYKTRQKECYKNASELVVRAEWMATHFDPSVPDVKYVEGFAYSCGIMAIEHAFVKVGDQYIDPTFERALHEDVRKHLYVSLIELDPYTMEQYLADTGVYGDLYRYDYLMRNCPEIVARILKEKK